MAFDSFLGILIGLSWLVARMIEADLRPLRIEPFLVRPDLSKWYLIISLSIHVYFQKLLISGIVCDIGIPFPVWRFPISPPEINPFEDRVPLELEKTK